MIYSTFFVINKGIYATFLCLFQYAAFVLIFFLAKLIVVILWFVWNDKVSTTLYKHGSLLFLTGRSIMLWKGGIIMSKIQNRVNFNLPRWSFQHQCQPCCVFRSRLGWRRSYLVSFIITIKTMIWPPTKYLLPGTTCSCL